MKTFIFAILITVIFIGCSTIKETTTTSTAEQIIPKRIVSDTQTVYIPLPLRSEEIDSIGRWYLLNYCKGEANIDQNDLKATVKFYVQTVKVLKDSMNKQTALTIKLATELEAKEQKIKAITTVTEKKETPGGLWIWWNSARFWIPAFIVGVITGAVGLFLLRSKLKALLPL